jgi:hypothetical protein
MDYLCHVLFIIHEQICKVNSWYAPCEFNIGFIIELISSYLYTPIQNPSFQFPLIGVYKLIIGLTKKILNHTDIIPPILE